MQDWIRELNGEEPVEMLGVGNLLMGGISCRTVGDHQVIGHSFTCVQELAGRVYDNLEKLKAVVPFQRNW